ncbi:TIGR00730 family Rossman fold protein [Lacticaseibacillus zhaodongensis]|uniref:LOG family protein n=1 Tax=Lacticaseibacillus zhaodongensis TaxID=2668065 RepID=UPI0012D2FA0D|nr:TIGR00730 family Rossman fold protein [Lacticaseibacillus zhaodongensis]
MKLTVFCGSRFGKRKGYEQVANALGWYMGRNNIDLIYGGSQSGIMGTISGAVLAAGGKVTGIYPEGIFDNELPRYDATENIVTKDMDERKRLLMSEPDAIMVFPGGLGTLEEISQALSWMAIGLLPMKPIGIFNMNHYYDSFIDMLNEFVDEEFADSKVMDELFVSDNFETLLTEMAANISTPDELEAAN